MIHRRIFFLLSAATAALFLAGTHGAVAGGFFSRLSEDVSNLTSKEVLGTGAGALLGGVLGSQLGDGNGQIIMTVLGTAAGSFLGHEIGVSLSDQDEKVLSQKSIYTASKTKDNQTVYWNNPDTGVQAKLTPRNTRQETRRVTIVRDKRVMSPPPLEIIGEPYMAIKSSNVRTEPSTNAPRTASLTQGERVNAVGKVKGSDWIMVSRNNKTIGYVYAPLLKPALSTKNQPQGFSKAVDFDALEDQLAQNDSVVVEEIAVDSTCRDMNYDVTTQSKTTSTTVNICKSPNGAWELI